MAADNSRGDLQLCDDWLRKREGADDIRKWPRRRLNTLCNVCEQHICSFIEDGVEMKKPRFFWLALRILKHNPSILAWTPTDDNPNAGPEDAVQCNVGLLAMAMLPGVKGAQRLLEHIREHGATLCLEMLRHQFQTRDIHQMLCLEAFQRNSVAPTVRAGMRGNHHTVAKFVLQLTVSACFLPVHPRMYGVMELLERTAEAVTMTGIHTIDQRLFEDSMKVHHMAMPSFAVYYKQHTVEQLWDRWAMVLRIQSRFPLIQDIISRARALPWTQPHFAKMDAAESDVVDELPREVLESDYGRGWW